MKVAIYARVSMTDQTTETQLYALKNYAERMGWDYEIFEEIMSTRKTRPVQYGLYSRLLKKEYDGLLIYKFDRWARSTSELVNHMRDFESRGVRFISYTENVDLGTSTGKLLFTIIAAMAEFERELIRERTLAGLARARAQGKKLGRPIKGKEKPKPSINKVAELFLGGMSIRDMAKELGTTKYWIEWSLKEMKDRPDKLKPSFRRGVFTQ